MNLRVSQVRLEILAEEQLHLAVLLDLGGDLADRVVAAGGTEENVGFPERPVDWNTANKSIVSLEIIT